MIAAVYIGFAVADGRTEGHRRGERRRRRVLRRFAAVAVTVTPWLVVALYLAHGAKDLWQHRTQFVRGTRWWPPFCFAVDMAVAGIVAAQLLLGVNFHS